MNKNDVQLLENILKEVGKCSCGKKKEIFLYFILFYFSSPLMFDCSFKT
jgi:hypothetical protein